MNSCPIVNRIVATAMSIGLSMISAAPVLADQQRPSIEQSGGPKMRKVDRDWEYFKSVHCDNLDKIVFHSRSEEILLAKRKAQCVDKYKAFLSKPIKR